MAASSLIQMLKNGSWLSWFLTVVMWCLGLRLPVLSQRKAAMCTQKLNFDASYLRLAEPSVCCRLTLQLHLSQLQKLWLPNLVDWHFAKVPQRGNKRRERLATAINYIIHAQVRTLRQDLADWYGALVPITSPVFYLACEICAILVEQLCNPI